MIEIHEYWWKYCPERNKIVVIDEGGDSSMWKKIGKFLLEVFAPWAASKLNRDKAAKLEKAVDVTTDAIEAYNDIRETRKDTTLDGAQKTKLVKKIAGEFAKDVGLDTWFQDRVVKKYTDQVKNALRNKADKILERFIR